MNTQSAIVMAVEIKVPAADKVEVRFVCPDGSVHHAPAYVLYQEYSDMFKDIHGCRPADVFHAGNHWSSDGEPVL